MEVKLGMLHASHNRSRCVTCCSRAVGEEGGGGGSVGEAVHQDEPGAGQRRRHLLPPRERRHALPRETWVSPRSVLSPTLLLSLTVGHLTPIDTFGASMPCVSTKEQRQFP